MEKHMKCSQQTLCFLQPGTETDIIVPADLGFSRSHGIQLGYEGQISKFKVIPFLGSTILTVFNWGEGV